MTRNILLQIWQVAATLLLAPLLQGIILQFEERVQRARARHLPALSRPLEALSYVILDPLGAWVILCAAIVYFLGSLYAIGYMRQLDEEPRLPRFYALFAAFALTTMIGPMHSAGLYWIAIELTTLVGTFLVAFEHAAESIEAAWKCIIVVSGGDSRGGAGPVRPAPLHLQPDQTERSTPMPKDHAWGGGRSCRLITTAASDHIGINGSR
jgi:formate hydrogenlyase subunit 3/multisubunit Na+/H+ antiporter MnhD subunit